MMLCPMTISRVLLLLIVLPSITVSSEPDDRIELHIGGIFPMSAKVGGWAGGQACLPAALMALDDINNRRDVIPGYKLVLHGYQNDSKCQPGLAAKIMYELIYSPPTKLILLSGCSLETAIVGEAAEMWNLLVMGYGASSPAFSNKERFPTLFRTHPSATIHNPARLAIFHKYGWQRIAIMHSIDEVFVSTADDLEKELAAVRSTVVVRTSGAIADAIANLKREDARIIVAMFYEQQARQLMCEIFKKDLFGARYVWFLIGWYKDNWYLPESREHDEEEVKCTAKQMKDAAQYHFTTEGLMKRNDDLSGIARMTSSEFEKRLMSNLSHSHKTADGIQEAPLAYDAIWAVALAFNCTIEALKESGSGVRLENFNYSDNATRGILTACMKELDFQGVSGQVKFSGETGDRITLTQIEQLQGDSYVVVGNYNETHINWKKPVKFHGGKPPQDRTLVKPKWKSVSVDVYGTMTFFAGVGIAAAIMCISFNYSFSYRKLIYLSQYQVNNLMLAGCVVCFVAVFITGLPMQKSPESYRDTFSALCHARITLLMYGFTLVYGALFSKVWIVHRMGSVDSRDQAVPAWKFYAVIGALAAIDTIIALLWVVIDPLKRIEEDVQEGETAQTTGEGADDVKIDEKLEHCTSRYQHVWIGLVYSYKGLLLLFGLFLAYEIRNAKAKYINDSRFVSMAIYNVAILCLITGPVALIIRTQPDANFGFTACTILLCTFISMGLIFVPKVVHVIRVPNATEHKQSSGAGGSSSIDTSLTKEELDRLKKLTKENEDIQRQISEKDVRIMELRKRLETCIAKERDQFSSGDKETPNKKSVGSIYQQPPNCQLNKSLLLPRTVIPNDGVVVATKRSSSSTVAPLAMSGSSGSAQKVAPTEPLPAGPNRDADDSGYRSSIIDRNYACAIEPADTDVLL